MMQLVNENVSILNPTKDNLILDPAGVEQTLGVPPQRVIDVMALRGDSIDNIPGAPGIGDKGSVELIQQFGTVEAAMDAAVATPDAIKRKTYRESLANNRDNILLSKELVTIHTAVPIESDLDAMRTQPVDNAAAALSSPNSNSPRCSKNSPPRPTQRRRPTTSTPPPTISRSSSPKRARKITSRSPSPQTARPSPKNPPPNPPIPTPTPTSKPSPNPNRRRRCTSSALPQIGLEGPQPVRSPSRNQGALAPEAAL